MLDGLPPSLVLHPNVQCVSDLALVDSIFLALTLAPESPACRRQVESCVTLFKLQSFISLRMQVLTPHTQVYTVTWSQNTSWQVLYPHLSSFSPPKQHFYSLGLFPLHFLCVSLRLLPHTEYLPCHLLHHAALFWPLCPHFELSPVYHCHHCHAPEHGPLKQTDLVLNLALRSSGHLSKQTNI